MDITDIDFKSFKRDSKLALSFLSKKDTMAVTSEVCCILAPSKYADKSINVLGDVCSMVGAFGLFYPHKGIYGVSVIPSKVTITPKEVLEVMIDDKPYTVLVIDAGQPLLDNTNPIKDKTIAFHLFEAFFKQAYVPFFYTTKDIVKLFTNLGYYADSKTGENGLIYEVLTSRISRNPDNPLLPYKPFVTPNKPPLYRGLKDIQFTVTSALSKIAGGYFKDGLLSNLTDPVEETSKVEDIIRE